MNRRKTAIFKAGLDALHFSRAHRALAPFTAGAGVIFTLHHVLPGTPPDFAPNRILAVTPEFLEATVLAIRASGLDIVSLDEARRRLLEGDGRRFACLTFDDGYRDNLIHAWPVLKRLEAPFCIYVTTCLPDHTAEPWWLILERAVAGTDRLTEPTGSGSAPLDCAGVEQKYVAYETVYWWLRGRPEPERRAFARDLADRHGVDVPTMVAELALTWDEIADLAAHPLVTIGAHTVDHPMLGALSEAEAEYQMAESRRRIGERIGVRPQHFAYPYGDPASAGPREFALAARLGFATAVTTRPGVLFAEHRDHLSALPRVSLNGDYQSRKYLDLYLTGAPFALWRRFRRVDAT